MDVKQANIAYYDALKVAPAAVIASEDADTLRKTVVARAGGARFSAHRVLECGCGTGWLACRLAASGFAASVVGLDISTGMLKACRETAALNGLDVSQVQGDSQKLPFRVAAFDFVCGGGFLHHLENEQDFFNEAFRVLEIGGALLLFREPQAMGSCLVVGIVKVLTFLPALALRLFRKLAPEKSEHELEKTYSKSALKKLGETAGFTMVSCRGHSFLHSIHWYLMTKLAPYKILEHIFGLLAPAADFMDEKILNHLLPRIFFYEISACFMKEMS